jgi:hypothetical protein
MGVQPDVGSSPRVQAPLRQISVQTSASVGS